MKTLFMGPMMEKSAKSENFEIIHDYNRNPNPFSLTRGALIWARPKHGIFIMIVLEVERCSPDTMEPFNYLSSVVAIALTSSGVSILYSSFIDPILLLVLLQGYGVGCTWTYQ